MDDGHGLFFPPPDPGRGPWPDGAAGQAPAGAAGPVDGSDLAVLDGWWSPEEELAQLLHTAADPAAEAQVPPGPLPAATPTAGGGARASCRTPGGGQHRRPRLTERLWWAQLVSLGAAAVVAAVAAVVGVLSGVMAYNPLRDIASHGLPQVLAGWWPLLVFGPWVAGALSVLRAALHRRRAAHAWGVVLLFSAVAVLLCVVSRPHTTAGAVVAGLPPIAALACFYQLVRQITLTRPSCRPTGRRRMVRRH